MSSLKSSWHCKRNGEVYVRGELVGSLLREGRGFWTFKPRDQYRKLLGVIAADTKRDIMCLIMRKMPHPSQLGLDDKPVVP